jgi:hypothetical protein
MIVCVERPDGTDVLQVLAELDGSIPVIDDEHAIERQFFAAPDGGGGRQARWPPRVASAVGSGETPTPDFR